MNAPYLIIGFICMLAFICATAYLVRKDNILNPDRDTENDPLIFMGLMVCAFFTFVAWPAVLVMGVLSIPGYFLYRWMFVIKKD